MRSEWWWPVAIEGYQIQARGKVGTGGTHGKVRNSGVLNSTASRFLACVDRHESHDV